MDEKTVKAIGERADKGIVVSVWRSENNIGVCFSKQGRAVIWDDMSVDGRTKAVQDLYAAADFFAEHLMQGQTKGLRVEQLTPKGEGK